MKSKAEVTKRLNHFKKLLKETAKRYDEFDNYDDMTFMDDYRVAIENLEWVLEIGEASR